MPIIFMLVGTVILLFIVKKIYSKNWNKKLGEHSGFRKKMHARAGKHISQKPSETKNGFPSRFCMSNFRLTERVISIREKMPPFPT